MTDTLERARFEVRTAQEAEAVLARFNGFRDSFVKRLALESHDEFEAPGAQNCTGLLDLTLVFMHHNYGAWNEINEITATFSRVTDLRVNVSGHTFEWHVSALDLSLGARPEGGQGAERPCLVAEVSSPRRADGLRPAPAFLFRFEAAVFVERGPARPS